MKFISKMIKNMGLNNDNVLVVDDVKDNVELVTSYLNLLKGVKPYGCFCSLEAERLVDMIDFSLIILDIQMPIVDGYELATKIKFGNGRNRNTPIMFVTGIYNSQIDKMKGYNIGAVDYILKPVIFDDFVGKIKKYIDIGGEYDKLTDQRMDNIKNSIEL